jgi:predicted PurR-regulated permease PerM
VVGPVASHNVSEDQPVSSERRGADNPYVPGEPPLPPPTRLARLWAASDIRGIPLRAILATVGIVIAAYVAGRLVYRLRDVLLYIVVAGFIALLLNQPVVALEGWKIKRGWAITIVTFLGLLVFCGLALAFGVPLANGFSHLADSLPGYVKQAEHGQGAIGHLVRKYHVAVWVQHNAPKLLSIGKGLAKPALSLGRGAFSLLLTLATIFVLVLMLLLEAPRMRERLLREMPPARAARVTGVARKVNRSVTHYMLGNVLTSLIAGLVVLITLLLLGVPFPFLWALWVALVDFLPMIGGALAGIPTILFAAGHSLTAGVITLVVFLVYTQIENHVLNPIIMSQTVKISPLLVLVSILVGASLGDWIGGIFGAFVAALLAIPTAGALQVIILELWESTASDQAPPTPPDSPAPAANATTGGPPTAVV